MELDLTEIKAPGSVEHIATVQEIAADGTIHITYENGKHLRAQPNGRCTERVKSWLTKIFLDITEQLGAPYLVVQVLHDSCRVWVPDGDGSFIRLRTLMLDAGVVTTED